MKRTVTVIAELGSNPSAYAVAGCATVGNWDFESFCRAASEAGATHVKIQLWKTESFPPSEQTAKLPLEFPRALLPEFVAQAHRRGLKAGASVFDVEAVNMAAAQCDFLKLAAREQNNTALIDTCVYGGRGLPVYRSISEPESYARYVSIGEDGDGGREFVTLYAVPRYPASMVRSLIALLAWRLFVYSLEEDGPVEWGWSSHSNSGLDCVLAARLGASVIEKHLSLSKSDSEGAHSLLPDEFGRMVSQIRRISNATR